MFGRNNHLKECTGLAMYGASRRAEAKGETLTRGCALPKLPRSDSKLRHPTSQTDCGQDMKGFDNSSVLANWLPFKLAEALYQQV